MSSQFLLIKLNIRRKKAKESEEHEEHVKSQEILKNSGGNA